MAVTANCGLASAGWWKHGYVDEVSHVTAEDGVPLFVGRKILGSGATGSSAVTLAEGHEDTEACWNANVKLLVR